MRSIKQWSVLVAAVTLAVLAIAAGGRPATAQERVPQLANALLLFEQNVTWEAVLPEWAGKRDRWMAAVQSASTPAEVAAQTVALENSMRWEAVEDSWRARSEAWGGEMQSADSDAAAARGLLELERATKWSAVTEDWRRLRDPWVSGLETML
jgi:hypothetical protein